MRKNFPRGVFGTEHELCEHYAGYVMRAGYVVHREIDNWDLVLIEPETSLQIGIQAKLRPTVEVLAQALTSEKKPGPDVHAVLVPITTWAFREVADALGLRVLEGGLVEMDCPLRLPLSKNARLWAHPQKQWLPEVVIDTRAGVPGPRKVTAWKLSAVKLCLRIRERGYITSADFKELGLNRTWWFAARFGPVLQARSARNEHGAIVTRYGQYEFRDPTNPNNPDLRWPEIARALALKDRREPRTRTRRSSIPR